MTVQYFESAKELIDALDAGDIITVNGVEAEINFLYSEKFENGDMGIHLKSKVPDLAYEEDHDVLSNIEVRLAYDKIGLVRKGEGSVSA